MTRRRPALLLLAVLGAGALTACGGGDGGDKAASTAKAIAASGPADAQQITVVGTNALEFQPSAVTAKSGKLTITLGNSGGPPHDLVFADKSLPAIGTVNSGQEKSVTYTFTSGGTYDFVCTFHPGMDGTLTVS
jgi:plastocyanin